MKMKEETNQRVTAYLKVMAMYNFAGVIYDNYEQMKFPAFLLFSPVRMLANMYGGRDEEADYTREELENIGLLAYQVWSVLENKGEKIEPLLSQPQHRELFKPEDERQLVEFKDVLALFHCNTEDIDREFDFHKLCDLSKMVYDELKTVVGL